MVRPEASAPAATRQIPARTRRNPAGPFHGLEPSRGWLSRALDGREVPTRFAPHPRGRSGWDVAGVAARMAV